MQLKIYEIFYSLQGESSRVGLPTVFVRLSGCPMRCTYCDTEYAFNGGKLMETAEIMAQVKQYGTQYVTVTGGEPLAQKQCHELLKQLCDDGFNVSLETGGGMLIEQVDSRVSIILDIKTPASGESLNNQWDNLAHIKPKDEIKFVLADHADYSWAKKVITKYAISDVPILFSPVHDKLNPADLADWILADQLNVRMQLQMHKLLWGEVAGK